MRYRSIVSLIALLIVSSSTLFAQDESNWSLQFQVDNLSDLDVQDGSVLSVRYAPSEARIFRLSVGASTVNVDRSFESVGGGQPSEDLRGPLASETDLTVSVQRVWTTRSLTEGVVRPIFAFGPRLSGNRATVEEPESDTEQTQSRFLGGLVGNVGIEWAISSRLALSVETGALAFFEDSKQTIKSEDAWGDDTRRTVESSRTGLTGEPLRLGLVVSL